MNCIIVLTLAVTAYAQSYDSQNTPQVSNAYAAHYYDWAKAAAYLGDNIPDVYKGYYRAPAAGADSNRVDNPYRADPYAQYRHYNYDTPQVSNAYAAHYYDWAKAASYLGDNIPDVYKGYYRAPAADSNRDDNPYRGAADPYAQYRHYNYKPEYRGYNYLPRKRDYNSHYYPSTQSIYSRNFA